LFDSATGGGFEPGVRDGDPVVEFLPLTPEGLHPTAGEDLSSGKTKRTVESS
jgi:hypothetical protein